MMDDELRRSVRRGVVSIVPAHEHEQRGREIMTLVRDHVLVALGPGGRFVRDVDVRNDLLPRFYSSFRESRPAFWRLNTDLPGTLLSRARRTSLLREFHRPVRIVFGADDPYLNPRVARRFADLFPQSALELIHGARHYVQVDEPERVAQAIIRADTAISVGASSRARS